MSLLATILLTSDAATSTMNRSGKPGAVHNPDGRVFKRQSPKFVLACRTGRLRNAISVHFSVQSDFGKLPWAMPR